MPSGLKRQLDSVDSKLKASEYSGAFKEATEASRSIVDGITRLNGGDRLGGAASLLDAMGQLAQLGAALGPAGAAAGGIVSLITGIISAIMEMMNPEKETLEDRIEQIIKDEDLKLKMADLSSSEDAWVSSGQILVARMANTRKAFSEARDAGQPFVFDPNTMFIPNDITPRVLQPLPDHLSEEEKKKLIAEGHLAKLGPTVEQQVTELQLEHLRAGLTWEYLRANTNYEAHVKKINDALHFLDEMKPPYSEEWNALLDQALGYMYRMWISLHGLVGLVDQNGHGMFEEMRREIGGQFKEKLDKLSYRAQNICQVYTLWHKGGPDTADASPEPMYQRMGVVLNGVGFDAVGDTSVLNFAVSSRGTIFSSIEHWVESERQYMMCAAAGRRGTPWAAAKGPQHAQQIFIGELPDDPDNVVVACAHGASRLLSLGRFNEARGVGEVGNEWTPNEKRWGTWNTYTCTFAIGHVAIVPLGEKQYDTYVLGMNDDFSVTLYVLNADGRPTPVEGFHWTKEEAMNSGGLSLYESEHRRAPMPWSCSISIAPFAVQLGSEVRFEKGAGSPWKLRSEHFFWDENLRTHQGKFYSDGTFVMCSNRGVDMRYWNYQKGEPEWANDPTNEGAIVQKMPLSNGGLVQALQNSLRALKNPHS